MYALFRNMWPDRTAALTSSLDARSQKQLDAFMTDGGKPKSLADIKKAMATRRAVSTSDLMGTFLVFCYMR